MRCHPVKPDPLEHGGDGLVIYQDATGILVFRLREIKRHQPEQQARVSATIWRASNQLSEGGVSILPNLRPRDT